MGLVDSFKSMSAKFGKRVVYHPAGHDPVELAVIYRDFGNGPAPSDLDARFRKGLSRWFKFTVAAQDLPREPEYGDTVSLAGLVLKVRQSQPVSMGGEPLLYKVYANCDQRGR